MQQFNIWHSFQGKMLWIKIHFYRCLWRSGIWSTNVHTEIQSLNCHNILPSSLFSLPPFNLANMLREINMATSLEINKMVALLILLIALLIPIIWVSFQEFMQMTHQHSVKPIYFSTHLVIWVGLLAMREFVIFLLLRG